MKKPLRLSRGELLYREGLILENEDTIAEASPLPFFSTDELSTTLNYLLTNYKSIPQHYDHAFAISLLAKNLPALNFAYYALTHPLKEEKQAIPYSLAIGTPSEVTTNLSNKSGIYKIKIGIYDFISECNMLKDLMAQSKIKLIIDANCSLSIEQATTIANIVNNRLIYFEDPCSSIDECSKLKTNIALDELARPSLAKSEKIKINKSWIALIKPTICGFPSGLEHNQNLILTSSFESPIGIKYIEQVSHKYSLPNPGTDTLKYFRDTDISEESFYKKLTHVSINGY